jgi:serine/threonine protein kinase/tetratricopeptide (TPR) repeat protein
MNDLSSRLRPPDRTEPVTGPGTIPTRAEPPSDPTAESNPDPVCPTRVNDASPSRLFTTGPAVQFPNYEIKGEIGRGGMGVVYRARQVSLNRPVALKVLLGGPHASAADKARFRVEAEAVARLKHPNIVQVYDVGEHDGFEYIALELVDGENLRRWQGGEPIDPRTAAAVVARIAAAIQHAHEQGIIHRDLKPANILLATAPTHRTAGSSGEIHSGRLSHSGHSPRPDSKAPTDPGFVPKVTDFGLAKSLEGGADLTVTGIACGTPNYMAPEQVRGGKATVGPAVDVYGLGAVLFELLTGKPPFSGTDAAEVMDKIVRVDPVPVRRLNPKVPRDLQVVVAKCLEKDPTRRYLSAQDVADDLDRFLTGRPILARPISTTERAWRWCRRNPVVTVFLLFTTIGCVVTGTLAAALAKSEAVERAAKSDAEQTRDQLRIALERANAASATATAEQKAAEKARDDLNDALKTAKAEKAAADQERRRAVESLKLARSVIRNTLEQFAGHPRFRDPEFRELRDKLIRQAGSFKKQLATHAADDPEWLADLGDLAHWMGLLETLNGNVPAATAHYQDSAASFRRWAAADPDDPEPRVRAANSLTAEADVHYHAGHWPEAEARHREAVALLGTVVDERPDTKPYAFRLTAAYVSLYELLREQKRWADGAAVCHEHLIRTRELVRRFGDNPDHLSRLANAVQTLGQMLDRCGNPADAERLLAEAVRLREKAAADTKWVVQFTAAAARTWHAVADHYLINGQRDRAGPPLARAAELIEEVNRVAPGVPEYVLLLVEVATMQGELLRAAGAFDRAGPRYDLAVEKAEDLVRRNPDPPHLHQFRTAWAAALTGRAHLYNHQLQHDKAAAAWDRLSREDPDVGVRPRHANFVLQSYVFAKDWRKAAAGAEKLATGDLSPPSAAEIARVLCNASRLAAADEKLSADERKAEAGKVVALAVRCLERAKSAGLFRGPGGVERFLADKDFEPVRGKFDPRD